MTETKKIRVLFICLGNICRSPMAEAVFRQLVEQAGLADRFLIESAGTGSWHIGEQPHRGTIEILRKNGISVGGKRAQQLQAGAPGAYDYLIAMDADNVADTAAITGQRVPRLLDFAPPGSVKDVPDPYYTGNFDEVYQLVRAGAQGLLKHIRQQERL